MKYTEKLRIRKFVAGKMTNEEEAQFELDLAKNEELLNRTLFIQKVLGGIEREKYEKEINHRKAATVRFLPSRYMKFVASFLLISIAAFLLYNSQKERFLHTDISPKPRETYGYDFKPINKNGSSRDSKKENEELNEVTDTIDNKAADRITNLLNHAIDIYEEGEKEYGEQVEAFEVARDACYELVKDHSKSCCDCQYSYWVAQVHKKYYNYDEASNYLKRVGSFSSPALHRGRIPNPHCLKKATLSENESKDLETIKEIQKTLPTILVSTSIVEDFVRNVSDGIFDIKNLSKDTASLNIDNDRYVLLIDEIQNQGLSSNLIGQVSSNTKDISVKNIEISDNYKFAWMNINNTLEYIENIKNILIEIAPIYEETFLKAHKEYEHKFVLLDEFISKEVSKIPTSQSRFASPHPCLKDYAANYEIQFELIRDTNSATEAIKRLKGNGVPIFYIKGEELSLVNDSIMNIPEVECQMLHGKLINNDTLKLLNYHQLIKYNTDLIINTLKKSS